MGDKGTWWEALFLNCSAWIAVWQALRASGDKPINSSESRAGGRTIKPENQNDFNPGKSFKVHTSIYIYKKFVQEAKRGKFACSDEIFAQKRLRRKDRGSERLPLTPEPGARARRRPRSQSHVSKFSSHTFFLGTDRSSVKTLMGVLSGSEGVRGGGVAQRGAVLGKLLYAYRAAYVAYVYTYVYAYLSS